MCVCLFVYLSVCLSGCLFVCLFAVCLLFAVCCLLGKCEGVGVVVGNWGEYRMMRDWGDTRMKGGEGDVGSIVRKNVSPGAKLSGREGLPSCLLHERSTCIGLSRISNVLRYASRPSIIA